jgi:26S proteasome regulatory subunit N5
MSELLVLSDSETEKHLTRLICDGNLRAKIDRPAGIVYFRGALQSPEDRLNKWLAELMQLMALLSKTNHLINATSPMDNRLSPVLS